MSRCTVVSSVISTLVLGLAPVSVFAQPVLFTGDAVTDFSGDGALIVADPAGIDVGVPIAFPAGTISGNDLQDVRFSYDADADTLYVGFTTYRIGGDVDGDGDAGRTGPDLAGIGGADLPDFGGTESFALLIDIDEDGVFDIIAGVSGATDLAGFSVNTFAGTPFAPGFAFGAPLPDHIGAVYGSPDADAPHIEFTILRFSELLAGSEVDGSASFGINAFVGSFGDAGIGEDFTPGAAQALDICLTPNAPENTCNGFDDDCDGAVDEDVVGVGEACTVGTGSCEAPGEIVCGDGALVCDGTPGAPGAETCNGADDDCDGETDEDIAPTPSNCGVGTCAADGEITCQGGQLVDDCTPGVAAAETCDGTDEDCDGDTDEGIAPVATDCGVGACAADGELTCQGGALVDSCAPGAPAGETCDGADNDCDGEADEDIAPVDTTCGEGACAGTGELTCQGGALVDSCAAGAGDAETCNGVDDDCDGAIDEGIAPEMTRCGVGVCTAKGQRACVDGEIVDSCTPGDPMGETCNNVDDDCDGETDEDIADRPVQCGVGACLADGAEVCDAGEWVDTCEPGEAVVEECNGADDDCDGETDEAARVYRITNWDGGAYGLMAWHFNNGGIFRWNMDDVLFTVRADGTATMAGQVSVAIVESGPGDLGEQWHVEMEFEYKGQGDAFGGPKIEDEDFQTPAVTAEWKYWDMTSGHMSRDGSVVKLEQRPRSGNFPFQLGISANGKDRQLGVALWFYYIRYDENGRTIASRGDLVAGAELIEDSGCFPSDEICDGIDNDQDGEVDEGFGTGKDCSVGEGECAAQGTVVCDGPDNAVCDAEAGEPGEEVCNGADDDCDGDTDEGIEPEMIECGVGACASTGKQGCIGGEIVDNCEPGAPSDEVCDETDNDCDGETDEGGALYAANEYSAGGHAIWMPDFARRGVTRMHLRDDARLAVRADGSAKLTGTAFIFDGPNAAGEEWHVDVTFEHRGQGPVFGGPKIERAAAQPPAITDLWNYYDMTEGTLTRPGSVVTLTQRPADGRFPMQLGDRANGKDNDLGLAVWFHWVRRDADGSGCDGHGDFNLDLEVLGEGVCIEGPEVCDDWDNDLDGETDEGFGVGDACTEGVGACADEGSVVCDEDGGATCNAHPGEPSDELCNDVDDDCDGEIDEGTRTYAVSAYNAGGHAVVANGFGRNGGHVRWQFRDDARLAIFDDGSANLAGTAFVLNGDAPAGEEWHVDVDLTLRGRGPAFGGPKIERPNIQPAELQAIWDYYDMTGGTISRGDAVASLTQRPADGRFPYQMGPAANNKDADFGASVWFNFTREDGDGFRSEGVGDFNIDLDFIGDTGCFSAPEICNGEDDDLDGEVDEGFGVGDACSAGIGACQADGVVVCDEYFGSSCDAEAGAPSDETCDGTDEDCDGETDEDIAAVPTACGVGACGAAGELTCIDGALVDSCAPGAPAAETCDGTDEDCDGAADEGIAPTPTHCGTGACGADGELSCVNGALVDSCAPGAPSDETCDGTDEDCDGATDEGIAPTPTHCGTGACGADGELSCVDGALVDSCSPGAPSDETCDSTDEDCDGAVDEIAPTPTECGVGACGAAGELACVDGEMVDSCAPGEPAAEVCDDADNDCDGEIDEGGVLYRANEYSARGHAIWMPDFERRGVTRMHFRDDAMLIVRDDGTASLRGTAFIFDGPLPRGGEWHVDVNFQHRGEGPDFGGPKIERPNAQPPAITDLWNYYDLTDGTLTRPGSIVTLTQRPANGQFPMQIGDRASGKDNDFGMSVWFFWERRDADGSGCDGHGDFNLDLEAIADGVCLESPEICNEFDDDLDGETDEGFGVGDVCEAGVGACRREGCIVCTEDGDSACDAVPGEPGEEVCNGIDDDCDGIIDEGSRTYHANEYNRNGHAFDGHDFGRNGGRVRMHFDDDAELVIQADGSATLDATAFVFDGDAPNGEIWEVHLDLQYRGQGNEFGGPKLERPRIQPARVHELWTYYDLVDGVVSRPGSVATLTQRPADGRFPYQMGQAANNKDSDFGASVWFHYHRVDDDGFESQGTGDFNIDLCWIEDAGCFPLP